MGAREQNLAWLARIQKRFDGVNRRLQKNLEDVLKKLSRQLGKAEADIVRAAAREGKISPEAFARLVGDKGRENGAISRELLNYRKSLEATLSSAAEVSAAIGAGAAQSVGAALGVLPPPAAGVIRQLGKELQGRRFDVADIAAMRNGIEPLLRNAAKYGLSDQTAGFLKKYLDQALRGGATGLSDRIWDQSQAAQDAIRRLLSQGMASGRSAIDIARELEGYFSGRLPLELGKPGVYANPIDNAIRLARSTTNHNYWLAHERMAAKADYVVGIRWVLSAAHPEEDVCDAMAELDQGMGPGVYPKGTVLVPPHPNCCTEDVAYFAPDCRYLIRGEYNGPILRLDFANDFHISVTPNHLFRGIDKWIKASELVPGDILVSIGPIPHYWWECFPESWKDAQREHNLLPTTSDSMRGDGQYLQRGIETIRGEMNLPALTSELRAFWSLCILLSGNNKCYPHLYLAGHTQLHESPPLKTVKEENYTGKVYTVQTQCGMYWAGGLLSANCLCYPEDVFAPEIEEVLDQNIDTGAAARWAKEAQEEQEAWVKAHGG